MLIKPTSLTKLKELLKIRPLAIYGLGGMGKRIIDFCKSNDIKIDCYIDKNTNALQNEVVISPDKIGIQLKNYNILIASPIYFDEIKQNLLKLGFTDEQIISYKVFLPEQVHWSDIEETVNWENTENRILQLSQWIDPNVASVADYGAGAMHLKKYLSFTTKYLPVDNIKRAEETIVCDLNSDNIVNISAEISVISGLLEYLQNPEKFIQHICKNTKSKIIITYMVANKFSSFEGRRASAYINDYTETQLVNIFLKNGYNLAKQMSNNFSEIDTIFLFEKEDTYGS